MAARPPIANVIAVKFQFDVGTNTGVVCIMHWGYTSGPPSGADCITLATAISGEFNTHLKSQLNHNNVLLGIEVLDLSSSTAKFGTFTSNIDGTMANESVPAGSAVLINHKIDLKYRGGKPRNYFPFFGADQLDGPSSWNSGAVTTLQTDWDAFVAAVNGQVGGTTTLTNPVDLSYVHAKAPRVTPVAYAITSSAVNPIPASQRRRNRPG